METNRLSDDIKHCMIQFTQLVEQRQESQQQHISQLQKTYRDILNPKPINPYICQYCKQVFHSRGYIGPHTKTCMRKICSDAKQRKVNRAQSQKVVEEQICEEEYCPSQKKIKKQK